MEISIIVKYLFSKEDAVSREKYLKSSWGRKFLKDVLKNYLENEKI